MKNRVKSVFLKW